MIRHRPRERVLAAVLAFLAGYVDALGFIHLSGVFISFMSGNSTRLGVAIGGRADDAWIPLAVIGLFVAGVVFGTLIGAVVRRHREAIILLKVAALLTVAAALNYRGWSFGSIAFAALAMGAANTVFVRDGEVSIAVTYVSGTLVKLGQRLATALLGGAPLAWLWYLLLWLGLVSGAVVGATVYPRLGLEGLWFAAGLALCCACAAFVTLRSGRAAL